MLMHLDVQFGDLRFNGSMRLPGAYRSLARPSSAPEPSHPMTGVIFQRSDFPSNPFNVLKRKDLPVHDLSSPRFHGVSSPSLATHITKCTGSGPVGI